MTLEFDQINQNLIDIFHDIIILEEKFIKKSEFSDVTPKELQELCFIGDRESCRATDIANNQQLSLSTITITLNRLEKKGYIIRDKSTNDRRVINVSLTERGSKLYEEHREFYSGITEKLTAVVEDEGTTESKLALELSALHNFLDTLK